MTGLSAFVAMAALLGATGGDRAKESPAPTVQTPFEGGVRTDAPVEGRVLDAAFPRDGRGRRGILLLVAGPGDTSSDGGTVCEVRSASAPVSDPPISPRILRLDTSGDPAAWRVLRDRLEPSTSRLEAVDLDGDGRDELIVGHAGALEVWAVGPEWDPRGEPVPLVMAEGTRFPGRFGAADRLVSASRVHVPLLGAIATFGPRAESGTGFRRVDSPVPVEVRSRGRRIALSTRPYAVIGRSKRGGDLLVSTPETVGDRRLRIARVEPDAPADERATECWARLPSPERLVDFDTVMLDGEPGLVGTTVSSEKMSFFGEKHLRVWRLGADRTRTGIEPIMVGETKANVWQEVKARVVDADGDGRDDLVLVYWKGLKDTSVAFEIWSRGPDGRWPSSGRATSFDVPGGDRSFLSYGDDLDGDGAADLIVAGKGGLRLHRGSIDRRSRPVARDPWIVMPLPDDAGPIGRTWVGVGPEGVASGVVGGSAGSLDVVDLDDDGLAEIVLVTQGENVARLHVYRLRPSRRGS